MPRERAPDVAGEIAAFRAWKVEQFYGLPPRLTSLFDPEPVWPHDAWMVATCGSCGDDVPGEKCSCGIYAARDRLHLVRQCYNRSENDGEIRVIGEVGLAGKVIVAERGWRAEKARVLRIFLPYEHWELARPLRDAYCVPVAVDNTLRP